MGSSRVICLNPEAAENGQIPGISYDGGYADYMFAPFEALASVSAELTAEDGAPLERVTQAMRALVHRADITISAGHDASWEEFARAVITAMREQIPHCFFQSNAAWHAMIDAALKELANHACKSV